MRYCCKQQSLSPATSEFIISHFHKPFNFLLIKVTVLNDMVNINLISRTQLYCVPESLSKINKCQNNGLQQWHDKKHYQDQNNMLQSFAYIDGILPKGPYPPCWCMADRALLAGYPRYRHDVPIQFSTVITQSNLYNASLWWHSWDFISSPPGQNGHHFTYNIFRCIFVNEKYSILIKISLKFVPKGPNDNNPVLVQITAWCQIGDKSLFQPMLTWFTDAYMRH